MLILTHRGITYAPNSRKALDSALLGGFSLETDLRISKDGKIIIIHDSNLKNTFGIDVNINELNYSELVEKDNKFADFIPDFESFIKLVPGKLAHGQVVALHIKDYKNLELVYKVCEIIVKYKLEKAVFIFDVLLSDAPKIKNRYPECKIGLSIGEKNYSPTVYILDDIKSCLQSFDIVWADEWEKGLYKSNFFAYCKRINKDVYVISPELHTSEGHPFASSPEALWKSIELFDFKGICTDSSQKAKDFFKGK